MRVINDSIIIQTARSNDLVDITAELAEKIRTTNVSRGIITAFIVGSTGAITTIEYEPGLIKDMHELYERIAPQDKYYHHDATWGDANGFSHVRAALQGPSITIPFENGRLILGTWQQVIVINFDNKPRHRTIATCIIGE